MKRFLFIIAFITLTFLSFGLAQGAIEIVLDNGVPATGYLGGDTVWADSSVRFDIRWIFTPGNNDTIKGPTNGLRVWTHQNGNYTDNFTAITYDTFPIGVGGSNGAFDGFWFQLPYSVDGLGADTISFGGTRISNLGVVDGFDSAIYWIETKPTTNGDTLCIDSSWYPPSNRWLWSTSILGPLCDDINNCPNGKVDWGGPYCYHVYAPGAPDDLQVDADSLIFNVQQGTGTATDTIRITSSGGAARAELDFTLTADQAWVSFDTAGGSGPSSTMTGMTPMDVWVIADYAGLDTGSYYATITVTSTQAGNTPFDIPTVLSVGTGILVVESDNLPTSYAMSQNYPNPFNPITEINFEIPVRSHVTLTVYNLLGQKVTTLVDNELSPNRYVVDWNGSSDNGAKVASGVYFYKLEADEFIETKKMILLK